MLVVSTHLRNIYCTNQAIFPKIEVNIGKTYWRQASKKHLQVIGWLIQLKFTSEFGNSCETKRPNFCFSFGSNGSNEVWNQTKMLDISLVTFPVLLKSCFLGLQSRIKFQRSTGDFRWWVFGWRCVFCCLPWSYFLRGIWWEESHNLISICFKRVSSQNHQLGSTD